MLPHYSPLKVAETFSILCGLHPGRIDLGARPRAGHRPARRFRAPARSASGAPDDFPSSLPSCLAYLEDDFPAGHRFARLAALPGGVERPDVWLLGSSPQSALWAAELGLPYSFADFINPSGAASPRPTGSTSKPIAPPSRAARRRLRRGRSAPTPTKRRSVWPPAGARRSRCCARAGRSRFHRSRRPSGSSPTIKPSTGGRWRARLRPYARGSSRWPRRTAPTS